jgi:hypothetical protein
MLNLIDNDIQVFTILNYATTNAYMSNILGWVKLYN